MMKNLKFTLVSIFWNGKPILMNDLHQFSIQDAKERLSALAGRLPSFVDIEVSSDVLHDFCSCLQFDLR